VIFHVARDGKLIGQFDEEDFREKLARKEIQWTDQYLIEGSQAWRPVYDYSFAAPKPRLTPAARKPPLTPEEKAHRQKSIAFVVAIVGTLVLITVFGVTAPEREAKERANAAVTKKAEEDLKVELIAQHRVAIGMTKEECLLAWGKPEDGVNTTINSRGRSEQWCYGYGRYLYFQNGVLVTIQN
jgi:hypothetical protein